MGGGWGLQILVMQTMGGRRIMRRMQGRGRGNARRGGGKRFGRKRGHRRLGTESAAILREGIFIRYLIWGFTNSCNFEDIFRDDPLTALDTFQENRFKIPAPAVLGNEPAQLGPPGWWFAAQ